MAPNGSSQPALQVVNSHNFDTVEGFVFGDPANVSRCDFGVIFLADPVLLDHYMIWQEDLDEDGLLSIPFVYVTGFPISAGGKLVWHGQKLRDAGRYFLRYTIDTSKGQSGSPVWYPGDGGRRVVGIHIEGSQSENHAVRITRSVGQILSVWARRGENMP